MANNGNLQVIGTQVGIPSGQRNINIAIPMSATDDDVQVANGTVTVAVPTAAVGCIITNSASGPGTITLKGVGGDTGLVLGTPTTPTVLSWVAGSMASFVVVYGGTQPMLVQFF